MSHPDKYFSREKRLLQLERETYRLHQATRVAPVVPLEQPYQRGWVKTFILRDDVLRRPDVAIFRTVLAAVNNRVHSRNREFTAANGQHMVLRPRMIRDGAWRKLGWFASHRRLFSYGHWPEDIDGWSWTPLRRRRLVLGYRLASDWWLREDIQPLMVTHRKVDLPDVKARLAEIESFMTATCGWARVRRLHGYRYAWKFAFQLHTERSADWDFKRQLREIQYESISD